MQSFNHQNRNNKTINRLTLISLVIIAIVSLNGCSWLTGKDGIFRSRGSDYLKAEKIPPLTVPEGTAMRQRSELYPVPEVKKSEYVYADEFEAPKPQAFSSDIYQETVKIQKLGDKRWIFINISPSEVWPRIRFFLNANQLSVDATDASRGVIETAWIRFKNEPETANKYQIKIEPGIQPDSAEVHVVHVKVPGDQEIPLNVDWPQVSVDPERESWMLDELAQELASDTVGRNTASLLAQTIGADEKVNIKTVGQEPVLSLEISAVRARATIQHSLSQGGFSIWEQDEKTGIYYLNYIEPGEEPGMFARLLGAGKETKTPYSLFQLIEHMGLDASERNQALFPGAAFQSGVAPLKKVPGYLAIITEIDGKTELTLRDGYGRQLSARQARELLGIIRSNLI